MFYDILERKKAFQSYKNEKSKNWDFFKGVSSWFWSKIVNFSILPFYVKKGRENVFHDILEKKKAVLNYKYKKFKKSKDHNFSKGVSPWFWSKIVNFYIFNLTPNRQGKLFHDILEKKRLL